MRCLFLVVCALLAMPSGAPAQQAEQMPRRLDAPEVIWRYPSLTWSQLGTLTVHPDGGVIVTAYDYNRGVTLFRVSRSGATLWQRRLIPKIGRAHV